MKYKVETVSTEDRGRYILIWVWARKAHEWIRVAEVRSPDEIGKYII